MSKKKAVNFTLINNSDNEANTENNLVNEKQTTESSSKTSNTLATQSLPGSVINYFSTIFNDVNRLTRWTLLFMMSITILFVIGLYSILQRLETLESRYANAQPDQAINKTTEQVKSYKNTLEVTQFAGSKGIIDFGSKVRVGKNLIETIDSPNCKISSLPPLDNNCFLTFSPSLTGLSKSTTIFTGISFEGSLNGDNVVSLELIDNQRNEAIGEKSVIDKNNFGQINLLPLDISSNYSIRMTLWQKNDNIKISKIKLFYLNINEMVAVSGKISGLDSTQKYTAAVFLDADQDKKLSRLDPQWSCTKFYPGIANISFQADGSFVLVRDSECYTRTKPEKWSQDSGATALPAGNWLFVVYDSEMRAQTFFFNIETVDKPVTLDFQYVRS